MPQYQITSPDGHTYQVTAPDGASQSDVLSFVQQHHAANPPPQKPQGADQGALMAGMESGADLATFGLDKYAEAALGSAIYGVPYATALRNLEANKAATEAAHSTASLVGDVVGGVASLPVGGAVVKGAEAVPLIGHAAQAVNDMSFVPRTAIKAGVDSALGAGTGYVQNGTPGAIAGAVAGPVAGAAVRGGVAILKGPTAAAYRILAKTIKMPGETLAQAASRLQNDADEFRSVYGRNPSLAEMADVSQGKEIGDTIRRTPSAQQVASSQDEKLAVGRQGELSSAVAGTRPSATAAQGDVEAQARQKLDADMAQIDQQRVHITPEQTQFLEGNSASLRSVMRGTSYDDARAALDDHLDQGVSPRLRDVETWRQAAARGARSADPVIAHDFAGIRDAVRGIGENVPEYADAMGDYAHLMRFGENLPEGAKGLSTAPKDFAAGFNNQPHDTIGRAAQAGQTVGLRTAISQKALQSPSAAAEVSRRLSEDAGLRQNIDTAFQPNEAQRIKRAGEIALKAGRGMASAVPTQSTAQQAQQAVTGHAIRTAALGVHGGSSSFASHNIEWLVNRAGLPMGTAKKVAELAMDPKNTPAVLQYLKGRGTTPAMRHEFMDLVRGGAAAAAGNVAARGMAQ